MTGPLTVAPSSQAIPAAAAVSATGKKQFDDLAAKLQPIANSANTPSGANVKIGLGDPNIFNALVAQFGPKDVSVPVGGTVTWNMFLCHSLTFGSAASDVGAFTKGANGSIQFNQKAGAPAGISVPPAAFTFPP